MLGLEFVFPDGSIQNQILKLFCIFIAVVTALSAAPTVWKIRKTGNLGDVNPTPYVFVIANAFSWIFYGLHKGDAAVALPNVPGAIAGLLFFNVAYSVASAKQRLRLEILIIGVMFVVLLTSVLITTLLDDKDKGLSVLGIMANVILCAFYVSPLLALRTVIKTRSASCIDARIAVVSLVNGLAWVVYGLVSDDIYVAVPNLIGFVFAGIQTACVIIDRMKYGRRNLLPVSNTSIESEINSNSNTNSIHLSEITSNNNNNNNSNSCRSSSSNSNSSNSSSSSSSSNDEKDRKILKYGGDDYGCNSTKSNSTSSSPQTIDFNATAVNVDLDSSNPAEPRSEG